MRLFLFVLVVMLCSAPASRAQWRADSIIPAELLLGDLDHLAELILESHTDPYRYCGEFGFNQALERARETAKDGLTPLHWFRVVADFMSTMRDSHSAPDLRSFFEPFVREGGRALPFGVIGLRDGVYVNRDMLRILPSGAKLETIHGVPALEAARQAAAYAYTEGLATESLARVRDAMFQHLFALHYHPLPDSVWIVFRHPEHPETTDSLRYPTMAVTELRKIQRNLQRTDPELAPKALDFSIKNDTMAILRIASFSTHSQGHYNRFVKKSFKSLSQSPQVNTLVIDIRDNPGGSSGRMRRLLPYLSAEPVLVPRFVAMRQSDLAYEKAGSRYKGIYKWLVDRWAKRDEDIAFYQKLARLPRFQTEVDTFHYQKPFAPDAKLGFKGNKFLLMNAMSGSASVSFAAAWRHHNLGLIIGEPCMGPMSGTWGNAYPTRLDNTGLQVFISTVRYSPMGDGNGDARPIQPDHEAKSTATDLYRNTDPALQKIKELGRK
jgi:hypothetical protein